MIRPRQLLVVALAGALSLAAATPLLLQDMEMPQPTAEHAMVQKAVGHWEGTVTMSYPGMPETPTPATEDVRSAGPFWVLSDFRSTFMEAPYEGHGAFGYDPGRGKYVGTWLDNMSSYLSIMEGEYDEATYTLTMTWNAPDMTGEIVPHRSEQVMGDEAYTMSFFTGGAKTMVIQMKRTAAMPKGGSGAR